VAGPLNLTLGEKTEPQRVAIVDKASDERFGFAIGSFAGATGRHRKGMAGASAHA